MNSIKKGDYIRCADKISKVVKVLKKDKYPYLVEDGWRLSRTESFKVIPDFEGFVRHLRERSKSGFPIDRAVLYEYSLMYNTPTY